MDHHVPEWYRDAKFGIMVHWGLPSIPAFAPTGNGSLTEILASHDWAFYFRNNPYAEWYLNSLRVPDSPAREYHRRKFNPSYRYGRLAERFNEETAAWDPGDWAELFAEIGARYVVLVAKHHDGFLMWPAAHRPEDETYVAARDIVGELGHAVRQYEMHYGLYYSGLLDWTVQTDAITGFEDFLRVKTDEAYAGYAWDHFTELITKHRPDILWNDIGLPPQLSRKKLFSFYREAVPGGVLNDRWTQVTPLAKALATIPVVRKWIAGGARKSIVSGTSMSKLGDVPTAEYAQESRLSRRPWEAVRSIGNSFAYNAQETDDDYLDGEELARLLADVVSKNGNLLLNVGPQPDGSIPRPQRRALLELGEWLRLNSRAIYGTRPWRRAEGRTDDGTPVRFTATEDTLYAILLERPRRLTVTIADLDIKQIPRPKSVEDVRLDFQVSALGCEQPVVWQFANGALEIRIPAAYVPVGPPVIEMKWRSLRLEAPRIEMYTDVIG